MDPLASVQSCLRLALLLAGLLLPGAALARVLQLPRSLALWFTGSAVLIYACALALNFVHVPLSLGTLLAALCSASLVTHLVSLKRGHVSPFTLFRRSPLSPTATLSSIADTSLPVLAPFTRLGPLTPFLLLFWTVVAFLLVREPLAGPDTGFRWAWLPEQWLRFGNLDFYPPLSAQDFLSYFWAESIPPGVASLHAWAFASGGSFAPAWIVPVTALQFLALHDLAWRAGQKLGGDASARAAALLLAACPLLAWSTRLAQETGLTAVAALGLAWSLLILRDTRSARWAAAAGLFAALGAITREYGLVFPALAAAALTCLRAPRSAWLAFVLAAVPVALAWPLHTTLRTGNPFYSLDVAGLFPVNRVFATWVGDNATVFRAIFAATGWRDTLQWFSLAAAPALVGWVALLVATFSRLEGGRRPPGAVVSASSADNASPFQSHRGPALFALASVVILLALWLASVPYTVGGPFYSLRVANPALALGAVVAGLVLARIRPLLLGAFLLATLPFTLLLPRSPLRTPPRDWPAPWRAAPTPSPAAPEAIIPAILAQRVPLVVTDSPGFQKLLAPYDVAAIPFWSPQVAWLFDPRTSPAEAAARWRASGLRLLVLSKFDPALAFVNRRARWSSPPFAIRQIAESEGFIVLQVNLSKL